MSYARSLCLSRGVLCQVPMAGWRQEPAGHRKRVQQQHLPNLGSPTQSLPQLQPYKSPNLAGEGARAGKVSGQRLGWGRERCWGRHWDHSMEKCQGRGQGRCQGRGGARESAKADSEAREGARAHLAVGWHSRVVESSLQQPHQQILHLARAVAHPQQPLLQGTQAGHILGRVEAQDFAIALEELHHRQAVGEGSAGQDEAWDAGKGWQGLQKRSQRRAGQGWWQAEGSSSRAQPSTPTAPAHLVVP